ncbi:hypothetical protein VTN77DRAFT_6818 [Rasamsonia byssochlamydoides]|uniref:uncharacterized protein n=1 Tax=Rasamsonia byssochlamydoides TaxID=89139 RepID=UPI0037430480
MLSYPLFLNLHLLLCFSIFENGLQITNMVTAPCLKWLLFEMTIRPGREHLIPLIFFCFSYHTPLLCLKSLRYRIIMKCPWSSVMASTNSRYSWKSNGISLTPDDYRAKDTAWMAQHQAKGKKYTDAMMMTINCIQSDWNHHCTFIKEDPYQYLAACLLENVQLYANWQLANFNIKKQKYSTM